MEVLHHEREKAAALAQAEVLEAAVGAIEDFTSSASFSVSSHSRVERTKDYVENQTQEDLDKPKEKDMQDSKFSYKQCPEASDIDRTAHSLSKTNCVQDVFTELPYQPLNQLVTDEVKQEIYDPLTSCFSQKESVVSWPQSTSIRQNEASGMLDFAKYLACCELVNKSLVKFDDQPESFRAWKSAFV